MSGVPVKASKGSVKFVSSGKKKKPEFQEDTEKTEEKKEAGPTEAASGMTRKRQRMIDAMEGLPELDEWDPTTLPEGLYMVLEGKRRTGKTTFVKWLMQWYQKRFSLVWVMSNTSASGFWQEFVGDDFVFDGYHEEAIQKLFQRNDKIIGQHGEESKISKATGSALVIFDDCITKEIFYSDTFIRMATEGRHHLVSVIFITQDPKTISPKVRDNADVAVVFNQKTFRNKESIWSDFMNDVDKDTALALMAKYAVNHDALVCVQTNLDGNLKKNFFKSTYDKTKLQDPHYTLGGPKQKEMILAQRRLSKLEARQAKLRDKSDHRPAQEKVDDSLKAGRFTVDKISDQDTETGEKPKKRVKS